MSDRYTDEFSAGPVRIVAFFLAVALFAVYLVIVAVTSVWLTLKDAANYLRS